jgi:prophage maintenance system killer protein
MIFLAELEKIIRTLYIEMLNRTQSKNKNDNAINNISFEVIIASIKSVLIDGSNNGLDVLEIANAIILMILQKKFFVYENPQMALQIAYVYLKRQGVAVAHYSVDAITNDSTIEDIRALTATW